MDFAGSSSRDELQILLDGTVRVRIYIHATQISINHGYQSGKHTLLSVNYVIDGHQIVIDAAAGARLIGNRVSIVSRTRCRYVFPEPEALVERRPAFLRVAHVLVDAANRNQKIQLVGEDGARQQHHETHNGCVLEIRDLHFAWTELNSPADCGVRWWRLEAHRLPVR